jgi:hypothetical protein
MTYTHMHRETERAMEKTQAPPPHPISCGAQLRMREIRDFQKLRRWQGEMGTRVIERLGGEEKLAEGYLSVETGG